MAFAWRAMDAFYEEDERIVGHAADPYHRIDIRQARRHLLVRSGERIRRLNIDGGGQGDLNGHGGEQRAVLVYQIQAYQYWQRYFGRANFSYRQSGENLTVDGLPDDEVCIGDRYRIGEAEFEVTQPRVTCYRVGLRMGEPELPALLVSHRRPGFYLRVIREGHIQAGQPIVKTRTGPGALSVADIDALLYLPGRDLAKLHVAAQIPALSPGWQDSFRDLLAAAEGDGTAGTPPAYVCGPASFMAACVMPSPRSVSTRPAPTPSCSAPWPRSTRA
jgi:MOSC domain-containing protein YiiM